MSKDKLFQSDNHPEKFSFNDQVTQVFDDMLNRSVPFYQTILSQIAQCCTMPTLPSGSIYDWGCSTGALIGALRTQNNKRNYIGIDYSDPMIKQAQLKSFNTNFDCQFQVGDITHLNPLQDAACIVCNLVLQFTPINMRSKIIEHLFNQLKPGGILVIVEKIKQADPQLQAAYNHQFYQYKKHHGYSQVEVERKEASLTDVLWPETSAYYLEQLSVLKPKVLDIFFKWYNFTRIIAKK